MTGQYTEAGDRLGVTVLAVMPMKVDGLRTITKHGYQAIRFDVTDLRFKNKKIFREVRCDDEIEVGKEIVFDEFIKAGDLVNVSGISKGKGFAGAVKRYGFKGGPRTHGQSDRERAPGSSGSGTTPGRVYKGKRRAGHMGNAAITKMGMKVLNVDSEHGQITIVGSVPGHNNSLVKITKVI